MSWQLTTNVFRTRPPQAELERRTRGVSGGLRVWLPCILAVLVIATESTDTFSASHTSSWLRPMLEPWFGRFRDANWEEFHHLVRKSGHFAGYGTVCLTFLRAWLLRLGLLQLQAAVWRLRSVLLAVLSTFVVAGLDEWHQTFIPSRTGMFSDVVLDTLGGCAACALVALVFRWWRVSGSSVADPTHPR